MMKDILVTQSILSKLSGAQPGHHLLACDYNNMVLAFIDNADGYIIV